MARKIQGYKPHDEREYIPKAFGNRQDDAPIRVWIKTPTERDKREVEGDGSVIRFAVDKDGSPLRDSVGNPLMEIDSEETMRRHHRALERFVSRVENYSRAEGPIDTGAEFAEHGETEIVTEVYREIIGAVSLSDVDAKKSNGSPDSSSAATQASDGIAPSASAQTTNAPETAPAGAGSSAT